MAVKPKDETGRDWCWARGNRAAIYNHFEENRLSTIIAGGHTNEPQAGKFGTNAVHISFTAPNQSGQPGFAALAEAGGDLDISTGDFCIACFLFFSSIGGFGVVECKLFNYSEYGNQPNGCVNARIGPTFLPEFVDEDFKVIFDTGILSDGSQTTYSLVNGLWVPVAQPVSDEYNDYYVLVCAGFSAGITEWDNAWHYLAFSRSGNEIAIYFDGQKRAYYNYAGALPCCNGTRNKLYINSGYRPM